MYCVPLACGVSSATKRPLDGGELMASPTVALPVRPLLLCLAKSLKEKTWLSMVRGDAPGWEAKSHE